MLKKNLRWGSPEYQRVNDRLENYPISNPFEIERFCAELAWVHIKDCPLYPFGGGYDELFDSDFVCEFLIDEKHGGYRCPNVVNLWYFAPLIAEKGNEKQKKSLEYLGDMYFRYGSMKNPPAEPDRDCLEKAFSIFHLLGLNGKLKRAKDEIINHYESLGYKLIRIEPNILVLERNLSEGKKIITTKSWQIF